MVTIAKVRASKVSRLLAAWAAAAALTLGLGIKDAQAALWQFQDSLEPNGAAWSHYKSGGAGSGFIQTSAAESRSPTHNAFFYVGGAAGNWSSFGRNVNISVVYPGAPKRTCAAQVYIKGIRAHGQLEVIDGNTWTYLAIKPFDLNNNAYTAVTTPTFVPPRANIFVRAVLITNGAAQSAHVDDLTVQCAS